jgi:hypothetical protein
MQAMARFFADRLRADADAVAALGGCGSPTEAMAVQQRWLTEAGESYIAMALHLTRIGMAANSVGQDEAPDGAPDAAPQAAAAPPPERKGPTAAAPNGPAAGPGRAAPPPTAQAA